MSLVKKINVLTVGLMLAASLILASTVEAASVYNCSASGRKCIVKLEEGIVGDYVKVLDEKARTVAKGRIIKRKGAFAVIAITSADKTIRKGYPVLVNVENRNSNLQWAASFSNKD